GGADAAAGAALGRRLVDALGRRWQGGGGPGNDEPTEIAQEAVQRHLVAQSRRTDGALRAQMRPEFGAPCGEATAGGAGARAGRELRGLSLGHANGVHLANGFIHWIPPKRELYYCSFVDRHVLTNDPVQPPPPGCAGPQIAPEVGGLLQPLVRPATLPV